MSKIELLGALEAKKSTKQKCKQYCGTPCMICETRRYVEFEFSGSNNFFCVCCCNLILKELSMHADFRPNKTL